MNIARIFPVLAISALSTAGLVQLGSAQVSVLIADHGALVGAQTFHPGPPQTGDQVLSIGGGPAELGIAELLAALPPRPKIVSEPYLAPAPSGAAPVVKVTGVAPVPAPVVFVDDPIPKQAIFPDGAAVIVLSSRQKDKGGAQVISPHNPWGIRVVTKETLLSYTLELDGVIVGSQATALINSVPIRKGETQAGPFTLVGIRRREVIMEYDGSTFVLPEKRTITVRIPKS